MKTIAALAVSAALATIVGYGAPSDVNGRVDAVFARWNTPTSPGCAVGAAVDGQPALAKAYGMADLEHDVKNTPDTIFEAGSVSKQFTAAAVLLLAREGRLSLDDAATRYIPELPEAASAVCASAYAGLRGLRDKRCLTSVRISS